jgi:hypothetical protein
MIEKEKALTIIESGWHNLVDITYDIPSKLQLQPTTYVECLDRRYGMLYVKYHIFDAYTDVDKILLSAIENKLERLSARRCEKCGKTGIRIKKDIPVCQCLCAVCYAVLYSELHPEPSFTATIDHLLNY